jgi:hypothetical protein
MTRAGRWLALKEFERLPEQLLPMPRITARREHTSANNPRHEIIQVKLLVEQAKPNDNECKSNSVKAARWSQMSMPIKSCHQPDSMPNTG